MTDYQVRYQQLQEDKRANRERERQVDEQNRLRSIETSAKAEELLAEAKRLYEEGRIAEAKANIEQIISGKYGDASIMSALEVAKRFGESFQSVSPFSLLFKL